MWVRTLQGVRLPGTGVALVWASEQLRPVAGLQGFECTPADPARCGVLVIGSPFF